MPPYTSPLWMPYAQHATMPAPVHMVDAQGARIKTVDGQWLIDGIASWWSMCHGYKHPKLVQAVQQQAETLPHMMLAGVHHTPALTLAEKLVAITPEALTRVFFSDSGSTAVEVAMKMAAQYWRNKGHAHKEKFLSFQHGYHGDTMGAMSLADPEHGMHAGFSGFMPRQYCVPIPSSEYGFADFEQLLQGMHSKIAAVVIEPLVQGAGGMRFHSADVLAELHRITKQFDILFIADEIATGFGRTGHMFACEEAGITPDILCLGKALTGGMTTMGATLATEAVFEAFLSDELMHAFLHGPTYMANPIACAAALASLELFATEPRLQQVEAIEAQLHAELAVCRKLPAVKDVRVKGAIGVVQYDPAQKDMWQMRKDAIKLGVWLRPFGDILYITPPLTISSEELTQLTDAMGALMKG